MTYLNFQPRKIIRTGAGWLQLFHDRIPSLIRNCHSIEEMNQMHALLIRIGIICDLFTANSIIFFLINHPSQDNLDYARRLFCQIHDPALFSWNCLIRGYIDGHAPRIAVSIYKDMLSQGFFPDGYAYLAVIHACCHLKSVETGRNLHGQILKCGFSSDIVIVSRLVHLFARSGSVNLARDIFDGMPEKDVVLWTTMVSGYTQANYGKEALLLFERMKREGAKPNNVTLICLLSACGQVQDLCRGRWFHSYILEKKMEIDIHINNALVNMYAKCGCATSAIELFESMPTKNAFSWNSLISGLSHSGFAKESLKIFWEMDRSDVAVTEVTVVSALSACGQLADFVQGRNIHNYIRERKIKFDIFVGNALINMYVKCGHLSEASSLFDEMPVRDVFTWTVMIAGYLQENLFREALILFQEMLMSGIKPNEVTLANLLSACTQMGALNQGKQMHAYIEENHMTLDVCLGNVLVDMYAKCGHMPMALSVFQSMPVRDIFSWNAMIGGFAMHGHGREAIDLFKEMVRAGAIKPDHVTLTVVLCACSHSGLVSEGFEYFNSVPGFYNISRRIEHYGCMVDLLCRAGLLEEAIDFLKKMPVEPNAVIWGSLFAACRVHHPLKLGEQLVKKFFGLSQTVAGVDVLISTAYAQAGRWNDSTRVRYLMGGQGQGKNHGRSSVEIC